ncbi:MAG: alpha/beta hydrolase [Candidatus Campbellbacteria bacterium]|nr:alpha/beta hydrolase [Candidatus Campbellbacteria bacterium]
MKRAFIVHRWSGGASDDWRPWLKKELENKSYEVFVLEMPSTDTPVIESWVNHLASAVGTPDENTYFIGHSIGCQTILRYLESINTPIGGAVFVAGWFNLANLEGDEVKEIARPWIETPISKEKIKGVISRSALLISDNDPYGFFKENVAGFKQLGTEVVVLHNAGHITEDDGFKELPQIFKDLGILTSK